MRGRRSDIDLTGKTFNELFVNGQSNLRKGRSPAWDCTCSCGKNCLFITNELLSGKAKSCGHLRGQARTLDLTGKIFSDLTVLYKVANKGTGKTAKGKIVGKTFWHCSCSCGKECDIQTSDLTSGKRKDCGHSFNLYLHQARTQDITDKTYGYLQVIEMLQCILCFINLYGKIRKSSCQIIPVLGICTVQQVDQRILCCFGTCYKFFGIDLLLITAETVKGLQ